MFSRLRRMCVHTSVAGSLPLVLSGCFLGFFFPNSVSVELAEQSPLRGSASGIHTIAIASPSALETYVGLPDSSRGKLDKVGMEIRERLQQSGRFTVVTPDQYRTALATSTAAAARITNYNPDPFWKDYVLRGARAVNADGVLLLHGKWESGVSLGEGSFGRKEYKRQLGMSLLATGSGKVVWYQEATAVIREGIVLPQEEDIREPLVHFLVLNFLQTVGQ